MRMWIDTKGVCDEFYHTVARDTEGDYNVFHSDGEVCETTEFKIEEDEQ